MNKSSDFTSGIGKVKWLERLGLLQIPQLRLVAIHGLNAGDFTQMEQYLDDNPRILQIAKTLHQLDMEKRKNNPYYPHPKQEDFSGEISEL